MLKEEKSGEKANKPLSSPHHTDYHIHYSYSASFRNSHFISFYNIYISFTCTCVSCVVVRSVLCSLRERVHTPSQNGTNLIQHHFLCLDSRFAKIIYEYSASASAAAVNLAFQRRIRRQSHFFYTVYSVQASSLTFLWRVCVAM